MKSHCPPGHSSQTGLRGAEISTTPIGAATLVFGVVFGATAVADFGPPITIPVRTAIVLDRLPPALFAGLAVQSLVGWSGVAAPPVIAAAAGALIAAPLRSLPLCLATAARRSP